MNRLRLRSLGLALGVLAALGVVAWKHTATGGAAMLSEYEGSLRGIVIHYAPGSDFVLPVYRQFLQQLPADVRVYVLCPDADAYAQVRKELGALSSRLQPVLVGHAMTAWSRDRWIALRGRRYTDVICPHGEAGAAVWPQRQGDQRLAADLAESLAGRVRARTSGLYFDGGDLLAGQRHVFIAPDVITRNLQRTVSSMAELEHALQRLTGRTPLFLPEAPRHHAAMFMMQVSHDTVLVGDPSLARSLAGQGLPPLPGGADFSPPTQASFDSVASVCAQAGYRVRRIPAVPAADGKCYLTYVNVIIDGRGPRPMVYMPIYQGAEALNAAAERIWQEAGYQVRAVDCTSTYQHFGNLHCLVNVLERT